MFAYYIHNLSPFAIRLGENFGVRWYGLAYAAGFLIAYFLFNRWAKEGWLPLTTQQISDFLIQGAVLGTVLGGRIGYCLFYDWENTRSDPLTVFMIWRGGMASHGAVVGLLLATWIFARKNKKNVWKLWDALACTAPPGIFLGRIANFVNGELWGRPTTMPWAVIFPNSPEPLVPRHPSQLYEAGLEGIVLGIILFVVKHRVKMPGAICASFLAVYPILRIFVEFFREPDAQIGFLWLGLTQGQWLSIGMFAVGLGMWIFVLNQRKKI